MQSSVKTLLMYAVFLWESNFILRSSVKIIVLYTIFGEDHSVVRSSVNILLLYVFIFEDAIITCRLPWRACYSMSSEKIQLYHAVFCEDSTAVCGLLGRSFCYMWSSLNLYVSVKILLPYKIFFVDPPVLCGLLQKSKSIMRSSLKTILLYTVLVVYGLLWRSYCYMWFSLKILMLHAEFWEDPSEVWLFVWKSTLLCSPLWRPYCYIQSSL